MLIWMFGWLPACGVPESRNLLGPFCSDLIPLPNHAQPSCPAVFFHHGVQGPDVPHTIQTLLPFLLSPAKGKLTQGTKPNLCLERFRCPADAGVVFQAGSLLETSAEALEAQAGTTSSRVAKIRMLLFAHGEWEG